jgi:hypothetical protein
MLIDRLRAILAELIYRLEPEPRINQEMKAETGRVYLDHVPRIACADGFHLSVQTNEFAYCMPRDNVGPWTACEVGFPSDKDVILEFYAEDDEKSPDTVYPYVPIELIAEVILSHGGFEEMTRPPGQVGLSSDIEPRRYYLRCEECKAATIRDYRYYSLEQSSRYLFCDYCNVNKLHTIIDEFEYRILKARADHERRQGT